MKYTITLSQLQRKFKKIKSIFSDDTWFIAQAMMYLVENLPCKKSKTKRKPNEWSVFAGDYMRKGKTIQEAAKDWKLKK